jgi:hypothetical protein
MEHPLQCTVVAVAGWRAGSGGHLGVSYCKPANKFFFFSQFFWDPLLSIQAFAFRPSLFACFSLSALSTCQRVNHQHSMGSLQNPTSAGIYFGSMSCLVLRPISPSALLSPFSPHHPLGRVVNTVSMATVSLDPYSPVEPSCHSHYSLSQVSRSLL